MNKHPLPAAGVPEVAARTLLRQAELFEQLFGLHDLLDVAYVADTLRAAAGLAPVHDGPTSEKSAALEQRRQLAEQILQDVERAANRGHVARVQLVDGVPLVLEERVDPATIDKHLDAVLRASGSALRHYSMHKTLEDMRAAMRAAMCANVVRVAAEELLDVLDGYPEQLVPINRESRTVRALRSALNNAA